MPHVRICVAHGLTGSSLSLSLCSRSTVFAVALRTFFVTFGYTLLRARILSLRLSLIVALPRTRLPRWISLSSLLRLVLRTAATHYTLSFWFVGLPDLSFTVHALHATPGAVTYCTLPRWVVVISFCPYVFCRCYTRLRCRYCVVTRVAARWFCCGYILPCCLPLCRGCRAVTRLPTQHRARGSSLPLWVYLPVRWFVPHCVTGSACRTTRVAFYVHILPRVGSAVLVAVPGLLFCRRTYLRVAPCWIATFTLRTALPVTPTTHHLCLLLVAMPGYHLQPPRSSLSRCDLSRSLVYALRASFVYVLSFGLFPLVRLPRYGWVADLSLVLCPARYATFTFALIYALRYAHASLVLPHLRILPRMRILHGTRVLSLYRTRFVAHFARCTRTLSRLLRLRTRTRFALHTPTHTHTAHFALRCHTRFTVSIVYTRFAHVARVRILRSFSFSLSLSSLAISLDFSLRFVLSGFVAGSGCVCVTRYVCIAQIYPLPLRTRTISRFAVWCYAHCPPRALPRLRFTAGSRCVAHARCRARCAPRSSRWVTVSFLVAFARYALPHDFTHTYTFARAQRLRWLHLHARALPSLRAFLRVRTPHGLRLVTFVLWHLSATFDLPFYLRTPFCAVAVCCCVWICLFRCSYYAHLRLDCCLRLDFAPVWVAVVTAHTRTHGLRAFCTFARRGLPYGLPRIATCRIYAFYGYSPRIWFTALHVLLDCLPLPHAAFGFVLPFTLRS